MARDDEFVIDLSNFEGRHAAAYAEALGETDTSWNEDVEVDQPWDDDRDFDSLYSPESIWKARLLIQDGYVEKIADGKYTVSGSQQYLVHLLEGGADQPVPWATCSCPNGTARGGRPSCYHTAAVLAEVIGKDLSGYEKPAKVGRR
jgi:uncharacterized Zn finger protein